MSATGKNYVVDDFTTVYSSAIIQPGTVIESEGYEYRFIQNGATDVATAGTPLAALGTGDNKWIGCYDLSDGVVGGGVLGVAMAEMATSEYGFVLKEGIYNTCTVQDAVGIGAGVCADADGGFRAATGAEVYPMVGVAYEAQTEAVTNGAIYVKGI